MQTRLNAGSSRGTAGGGMAGYFAHHGVWAPGVRTFRRQTFRLKAMIISAMFAVPIALLAWYFYTARDEQIQFAQLERTGVQFLRQAVDVAEKAGAVRTLARQEALVPGATPSAELLKAQQALAAQLTQLEAAQSATGAQLKTGAAVKSVQAAIQALAPVGDGYFKVYASSSKLFEALDELVMRAADNSNLTLDPDLDSYYLMSAAALRLPKLVDIMSRMGGTASAAAAAPQMPTEVLGQEITRMEALTEYLTQQTRHDLTRVMEVHPEYAQALPVTQLTQLLDELREAATDGIGEGGAEKAAKLNALVAAAQGKLWSVQRASTDRLDELLRLRIASHKRSMAWVVSVVVVFLLFAAYLFYSFFLVMSGGFAELRRHLDAIASGDLSSVPKPWGRDEAAALMNSLRATQDALRGIVSRVRADAESISQGSTQIADGATDLSARSEQAAASLQQSASSVEQITATVHNTTQHAKNAATIAADNAKVAERGGAIMQSMVATMDEIQDSSRRIGEIIGTIDGIAFQTNILALNAAVEAARAGENGKGFAVVATEVRSLAKRSAEAAREIKSLIESSVHRVESGTVVVRDAGQAIGLIVENAAHINQLLEEISRCSQEQSGGIQLVGTSVQELDQVTQQNAALSEQTAAASTTLVSHAHELMRNVAMFRLGDHAASAQT